MSRRVSSSLLLPAVAALALAACSSTPEIHVPQTVSVPTPVPCVEPDKRPRAPVLRAESDLMAMDRYHRTLAAWQDLKKYEVYKTQLEAIVEACSRIPAPKP